MIRSWLLHKQESDLHSLTRAYTHCKQQNHLHQQRLWENTRTLVSRPESLAVFFGLGLFRGMLSRRSQTARREHSHAAFSLLLLRLWHWKTSRDIAKNAARNEARKTMAESHQATV